MIEARKPCSAVGPGGETAGLYIHVPFCKTKCPYCDFHSVVDTAAVSRWLACISREIDLYADAFDGFDTVYFGGGTPSLLSVADVARLMAKIRGSFNIAPDAEITIEANPDDVSVEKLAAYRSLGINRISLGVQSLSDPELAFLGRRHDAERALRAVADIRRAGFTNLGIDLIYGFEGQSLTGWERTLGSALDLSPEHLSCYQMTIAPHTPFGAMRTEGLLREINEEMQRRFFERTAELVTARWYIHYEVSNFARSEDLIARHNSKYWRHLPYLGLGPSAHSFKENRRWWNTRSVDDYCIAIARRRTAVAGSERLAPDQIKLEKIFLGFRTREGIPIDSFENLLRAKHILSRLHGESLIEITGGRAMPTSKGFLVADALALLFV
jgi:oxygen-independent coproporphyrinogen-3 oxidase